MSINSLATLLLKPRSGVTVAFSNGENIDWNRFLSDVRNLLLIIKDKECNAIALCCEDSYLFSVAFFAAIYADKKIILPGNHQPAMLSSLSPYFDLLIDDGLVEKSVVEKSITLPLTYVDKDAAAYDFHAIDLNLINITLFTSGSTGTPKAIHKTLLLLDAEIQALERQWGTLLGHSRIVSTVSHQHIYGLLFRVLWPLCAGRAFSSHDLTYTEQVINNATCEYSLISSPALLKRLEDEGHKGDYCAVFSSGGPLSADASDACKLLLNQTAIEVFGSTETGGIGYRQQHQTDTPWTFFPEVDAKLGSDDCLALMSPWLSEKSEGAGGYYQSSDQCELLENKRFILKGRIDRVVKIEEKRISLLEVENHINELPWISESAVIVVNEAQRITLGALLTLTDQGKHELDILGKGRFWIKLRQALRQWVEPVGIPRHFRVTKEIPINKQGKRLQQQIAELFR